MHHVTLNWILYQTNTFFFCYKSFGRIGAEIILYVNDIFISWKIALKQPRSNVTVIDNNIDIFLNTSFFPVPVLVI